jgi:hypothetical protein
MGNQPSAHSAAPKGKPELVPPPLPPVCDADCQRQKKLEGLKMTMDQKALTQATDPEGYEQARIAYFTQLNGQGWLAEEKQRIANQEISPKVTQYTNQYEQLKSQQQNQQVFLNLMNALKAEESQDETDLGYLEKKANQEEDRADVLNRLAVLNEGSAVPTNYWPTVLQVAIAILALAIVYLVYSKFSTIKGYFTSSQSSVIVGGKKSY